MVVFPYTPDKRQWKDFNLCLFGKSKREKLDELVARHIRETKEKFPDIFKEE